MDNSTVEPKKKESFFSSPWVWCLTTYFAEGFPYTLIRAVSPVFFRTMGVSLEGVGLTSLFGLPWTLKFLWGPYVDSTSSKRRWLLATQGLLVALFITSAFMTLLPQAPAWIGILFFLGSFIASTHDTAIDGYYLASLDKQGQAKFVGYRIMAFRVAMMAGTGLIVTIAAHSNWLWGLGTAGILLLLVFLYHLFFLPEPEMPGKRIAELFRQIWQKPLSRFIILGIPVMALAVFLPAKTRAWGMHFFSGPKFSRGVSILLFAALILVAFFRKQLSHRLTRNPESFYSRAFLSFMEQPKIGFLLAFIILVRAGEWSMSNMVPPFMIDLGLKKQYGWISAWVGLPCSITGALIGGWLISRFSLKRTIWPFLLLQNLTNVIYMLLAFRLIPNLLANTGAEVSPLPLKFLELALVAAVNGFDQFAGGLGNAVLATYLLRICKPEFKAAHYAIGSGLMSLTGIFVGILSGILTARIGYGWFFGLSFLFSLPGMLLIFFIPKE